MKNAIIPARGLRVWQLIAPSGLMQNCFLMRWVMETKTGIARLNQGRGTAKSPLRPADTASRFYEGVIQPMNAIKNVNARFRVQSISLWMNYGNEFYDRRVFGIIEASGFTLVELLVVIANIGF